MSDMNMNGSISAPNDQLNAAFVSDVSLPDGTQLAPSQLVPEQKLRIASKIGAFRTLARLLGLKVRKQTPK